MKSKFCIGLFLITIFVSCNRKETLGDNQDNGIVVFFSSIYGDTSYLKISINEHVVYDGQIKQDTTELSHSTIKIPTNIRDTLGYSFNVTYSNIERTFYLPAKDVDKVKICFGGIFNVDFISKEENNKDSVFTMYITKNIGDNYIVKIANNTDTLYNGMFLNNYPEIDYNTMKFVPKINNKGRSSLCVMIWNTYIYVDCMPEKHSAVNIHLNYIFKVYTNTYEDWEKLWMID